MQSQYPKLTGVVDDCCCDSETVEALKFDVLNPALNVLVTKPFFRYFKVRRATRPSSLLCSPCAILVEEPRLPLPHLTPTPKATTLC